MAITMSGSSQAFRSVDHHLADKNCAHALRERPASAMDWEFAPSTIQLRFIHRHLQDRRPISSPSPCADACY